MRRIAGADLLAACALGIGIVVAFEPGIFLGRLLIGYDATTLVYPWYANALLAFHHSPFTAFNPYQMGGMVNFNLLANYDPIYYLAAVAGGLPSLYQEQLLVLTHLLLVPLCLIALARLYGASGARLLLVGILGAVAAYTGFDLKYMETTEAIDAYGWGMVAITAIEYYRVRKQLPYAIVAALALDFALMRFAKGTVYWPLFVIPYIAVFWSDFKSRTIVRDIALASGVFFIVVLPCVIEMSHMWHVIEASKFLSVELEGSARDALAYLGYYLTPLSPAGQSVFAIPGIVGLMLLTAFVRMNVRERWFFGVVLGVLLAYALGQATPMEWILRHAYPPADAFRRAYEELYVVLPILFMVIVRYCVAQPGGWNLGATWRVAAIAVLAGFLALAIVVSPASWSVDVTVVACSVAFLYLDRWPVAAGALIVVQWSLVGYLPVAESIFYPHPATVVQGEIVADHEGIAAYLPPETTDAARLYRVVGVGVGATFGPYAGVFRFLNLAPDEGTRIPRALYHVMKLNADPLFNNMIPALRSNPAIVADNALREMSVRYYFLRPDAADIARAARLRHPGLRALPNPGDWIVLEDPRAYPFISALRADGSLIGGVPGFVSWGTVKFTFPRTAAAYVDLAYLYDTWWHVSAADGTGGRVIDNSGQLQIGGRGLQGKLVTLHFSNAAFTAALALQMLCYLLLAFWAVGSTAWALIGTRR